MLIIKEIYKNNTTVFLNIKIKNTKAIYEVLGEKVWEVLF
jgi:hypothetical protein